MILLYGQKSRRLYDELIADALPSDMTNMTYAEPFGGTFAVNGFLGSRPLISVYNDTEVYDFKITADVIEHMDFEKFIDKYDGPSTVFYIDPPYYGKENNYGPSGTVRKDTQLHVRLRDKLMKIEGVFVLSYEVCGFINMLYGDNFFKVTHYNGSNPYSKREMVITKRAA